MSKEELKKLMREMRYSRKDFAEKIEISIHTLDSWIQGKQKIPKTMSALIELTFKENTPEKQERPLSFEEELFDRFMEKLEDRFEKIEEKQTEIREEFFEMFKRQLIVDEKRLGIDKDQLSG